MWFGCVTVRRVCVQNGWSCLHKACEKGHLDVVKYLCEHVGEKLLMLTDKVSELGGMRVCAWLSVCMDSICVYVFICVFQW